MRKPSSDETDPADTVSAKINNSRDRATDPRRNTVPRRQFIVRRIIIMKIVLYNKMFSSSRSMRRITHNYVSVTLDFEKIGIFSILPMKRVSHYTSVMSTFFRPIDRAPLF